jgi:hypothetical protein
MSVGLDLGCGPPLRDRDYARIQEFQAVEEARDLGVAAMPRTSMRLPVKLPPSRI